MSSSTTRAIPNGQCWCDCGGSPKPGSFFLSGHDKRAERYLAAIDGAQSMADRLASRGFKPGVGGSLREATLAHNSHYEECGRTTPNGEMCRVIGKGAGMRRHRADDRQHGPDQA